MRHPFVMSLDKQSERYCTDEAEAVELMARCVDGTAKSTSILKLVGALKVAAETAKDACILHLLMLASAWPTESAFEKRWLKREVAR